MIPLSGEKILVSSLLNSYDVKDERYIEVWKQLEGNTLGYIAKQTGLRKKTVRFIIDDLIKNGLCKDIEGENADVETHDTGLIDHVYLEIAKQCMYNCSFCSQYRENNQWGSDLIIKLLEEIIVHATNNIKITLGYGDIIQTEALRLFLSKLAELRKKYLWYPRVVLWTSYIPDTRYPTHIHDYWIDYVMYDIDGIGTNISLKNPEGVVFTFTVTEGGVEKCKEYLHYLNKQFPKSRIYIRFPLEKKFWPTIEEFKQISKIQKKARHVGFYDDHFFRINESLKRMRPYPHHFYCNAGRKRLFVDVNGNVHPCERLRNGYGIGNLADKSIHDIYKNFETEQLLLKIVEKHQQCNAECCLSTVCGGCMDNHCEHAMEMVKIQI